MKAKRKRAEVKAIDGAPQEAAATAVAPASDASTGALNDGVVVAVHDSDKEEATVTPDNSSAAADVYVHALPVSCTVRDSGALKSTLLDLLMEPRPVSFDVRAVERIDTAAMQVLCAFVRDRKAAGGSVQWIGTTENFSEAVRLLGLQRTLDIPDALLARAA